MLSLTAKKALDAYGGEELWSNAKFLEAEVCVRGLAFTLKRRPIFEHANIRMEIGRPFSKLTPIGKDKDVIGVLNGQDVWLEKKNGEVIQERKNARMYFPFGRRLFYWDDLDMAYFANYAFWNYFTFPRLLMNESISWTEKEEGILEAIFPDSIPTHSSKQEFLLDKVSGMLLQHNYSVDIISKLAKAANVIKEHSEENGLNYPSSRKVTPMSKSGKALAGPLLIDIKVHHFKLTDF